MTPDNFRPISMTSPIIKVFEFIIRKQVLAFLIDLNNTGTQHGLKRSPSCLSALLSVFDDMMHMLDSDSSVHMAYIDFFKGIPQG